MKTTLLILTAMLLSGCIAMQPKPTSPDSGSVISEMRDAGCRFESYESRANYQRVDCYGDD